MEKKRLTSIRLSPEAKRLLSWLAETLGISQAAVLELAIREKAWRHDHLHEKEGSDGLEKPLSLRTSARPPPERHGMG
jgi:predicted transcriptional regulator